MNITIIGCGFLGSLIATSFGQANITVTTTSLHKVSFLKKLADRVVIIDRSHPQEYVDAIAKSDVIIISVAPKHQSSCREKTYRDTYLKVSQDVISNCSSHSHIIFVSSTSVYSENQGHTVSETSPLVVDTKFPSAILKKSEELILKHHRSTVLRLSELYGYERSLQKKVQWLIDNKSIWDKDSYTNMIHVDDVVSAIHFILDHQHYGIFNLTDKDTMKKEDFYNKLLQKFEIKDQGPRPSTSQSRRNKRVDASKIVSLGFEHKVPYRFEGKKL